MERLTILGSAFAVANQYQENAYLLLQTDSHNLLIDCGNNPVGKLQQVGVAINDITDLILTHAHVDHMGALPLLLMDMWIEKRQKPLNIFGLAFTLDKAKALLAIFNWESWTGMFPVNFHVVSDSHAENIIVASDVKVMVSPVNHQVPNIGIRMNALHSQKIFVYSCDTEPCKNLEELSLGADLLIQEAAGPSAGHTSPEQAGIMARNAGVKQLVLIHYNSGRPESELISEVKKNFNGNVVLAKDLLFFE